VPRSRLTYLLADQPASDSYTPLNHDPQHDARVRRVKEGEYIASFLGDDFNAPKKEIAMVGTVGSTTAQCSTGDAIHRTNAIDLQVTCVDFLNGASVNTKYTALLVGSGSLPQTLAFAVADQPTAASYVPDSARSFTTGKKPMLITRIGTGDWYVDIGTSSPQGTMYHVTSADASSVCAIGEWKNFGIRVKCFDRSGAPADVQYKVLQVTRGRPGEAFGSAWADERFLASYNPYISFFTSAGVDGTVTITRSAAGTYRVTFTGATPTGVLPESVLVSPFGLFFAACTLVNQSQSDAGKGAWQHVADVECRDAKGKFIDSRFTITLID
jgi:hypothetical protein